jgi:hypothetical protein
LLDITVWYLCTGILHCSYFTVVISGDVCELKFINFVFAYFSFYEVLK